MKKLAILYFLVLIFVSPDNYSQDLNPDWPVLKNYDQEHLAKIAMPIGGIGTGTVSLGGHGELKDWEIMNRPAKGFDAGPGGNRAPFFAIYTNSESRGPITKALMGPLEYYNYESKEGRKANNHGLPRFRNCSFHAAYPFGQVLLSDENMPVDVRVEAFNPMIPADADNSGIPIAVLRYVVSNTSDEVLEVSICGSLTNFIGEDGLNGRTDWKGDFIPTGANMNKNIFRKSNSVEGIYMYSDGMDKLSEQWGTIALTTNTGEGVSYRTNWLPNVWGSSLLDFWDDFSKDGVLDLKEKNNENNPMASLAVKMEIPPGESKSIEFFISWHFPNRIAWAKSIVGNYYSTKYKNAWDVIELTKPALVELENKTIEFVSAFCNTDLPEVVKEAALFNTSTLRSQTCFRTADGRFFGWEGCMDTRGSCHGSCTHVWNYEQATAFLFGNLAKTMRDVEFAHATDDNGLMSFRVMLPIENAQEMQRAAADGQMGTIMKMYRDWQLSGDNEMLVRLWPNVKKAVEFCWIKGGWDANQDGVMEGCQHNTMDVEYYGPNPQMGIWYLGALTAAAEMADFVKDKKFSVKCRQLAQNGKLWIDENLFNGEYYEHKILLPGSRDKIAPALMVGMGTGDLNNPDYQLGKGCLVDQLVGQYMAHICGLGYLVEKQNVEKSLQSIMKYNYMESMIDHFNCMRSYALGDESALLMASYPKERPVNPFPYFTEVMTGFEYTAAIGMLYEGKIDDGLKCITNIRNRYDGKKRSPFDEAECGHHYARAMASWASVLALTGFHYSEVEKTLEFAFSEKQAKWFWSTGYAWGTISQKPMTKTSLLELSVLSGEINFKNIILKGKGELKLREVATLKAGKKVKIVVPWK